MDLTPEERPSDSPLIDIVWQSRSEHVGPFISIANSGWGMVVTKINGQTMITVRGPEIRATSAVLPPDGEWVGIQFKPGTLMPNFPAKSLMDRCDVNLPGAAGHKFWLKGAAWQYPDFDNAETFVSRLVRDGLLLYDPVVAAVLHGEPVEMSLRTLQRRFLAATGLTHGAVSQIQRARHATRLLKQGVPILDVVDQAGYSDQPHLTRALKHLIGQTPAQILSTSREARLSFLFKTEFLS